MSPALEQLDALIDEIEAAVAAGDWEHVTARIGKVTAHVEPVMDELDSGNLSPTLVQQRLARLQAMCDRAEQGAESNKAEILATLKGLNQTRAAARSYEDVSSRRQR
ncbi:MAG: hypothetical protein KGY54_11160 [Oleiphilaceae bacterium]|nr:hypothetical protein [Oleiphilaceae bacterium]